MTRPFRALLVSPLPTRPPGPPGGRSSSCASTRSASPPVAVISSADAERLRANGSSRVEVEGQAAELAVRAVGTVPAGVLLVPRDVHWASPPAQGALARVAAPAAAEVEA